MKIKNLLALGVSLKSAFQHGCSSNSYWQMSSTPVIHQAASNVWLTLAMTGESRVDQPVKPGPPNSPVGGDGERSPRLEPTHQLRGKQGQSEIL
jgi:hypothetical protein